MELKRYQQEVLTDLNAYLDLLNQTDDMSEAYRLHWEQKGVKTSNFGAIKAYRSSVPGSPHVCIKVPTGGGKTFLAVNALHSIFSSLGNGPGKLVIWLVPSESIFRQTLQNLQQPGHPYREKLNQLFGGRVQVVNKEQLLSGAGLNPDGIRQNLTVCVLIYASLRAKNKDDRKLFQQNGALLNFQELVGNAPTDTELSVMQVVQALKPVVIVDESHNTTSELSTDMLVGLHPRFILDLTATPRDKSNIISFTDAQALKAENMVKLPVFVYNHPDRAELLANAVGLRRRLEDLALKAEKETGALYIRPIVLFQAQTKAAGNEQTFRDIKKALVGTGIKEAEIAIKTAEIDELKNIDLQSRRCPIRYIITINALKEGWDAPFAYILASMANRSSPVEVEQIVGRVLRLPGAKQHPYAALNSSYVLTASADFTRTLNQVVAGLNRAGFSNHDYRLGEELPVRPHTLNPDVIQLGIPGADMAQAGTHVPDAATDTSADTGEVLSEIQQAASLLQLAAEPQAAYSPQINLIIQQAGSEETAMRTELARSLAAGETPIALEVQQMRKEYQIKPDYRELTASVKLPVFYFNHQGVLEGSIFDPYINRRRLDPADLLSGGKEEDRFRLANKDAQINFEAKTPELYKIDLEKTRESEYTPTTSLMKREEAKLFLQYLNNAPVDRRTKQLIDKLLQELQRLNTPPQPDVRRYLEKVVDSLLPDQLEFVKQNHELSAALIKQKIEALMEVHKEEMFYRLLKRRVIELVPEFEFRKNLPILTLAEPLPSYSLYEREGIMNELEREFINHVTCLDNVLCWHRNVGKPNGFYLNAFMSHYPDFIIVTKSNHVMLVETKGAHLMDSSDSAKKIKLGNEWASLAGPGFSYYMAVKGNPPAGAETFDSVLEILESR